RHIGGGRLEFLGRVDQQVKVRGYRIEPGEVEAALREQAGVEQAVVVVREEEGGEKRLVGYVVRSRESEESEDRKSESESEEKKKKERKEKKEGVEWNVGEVREGLRRRLPEYMVRAVIVELEKLPLTATGKMDRGALPRPGEGRTGGAGGAGAGGGEERKYVAAGNEVEEKLCAIWKEVLGVERVGVEDNFFELGGDSILSIQVVARAREEGLQVTPKQMFEQQT